MTTEVGGYVRAYERGGVLTDDHVIPIVAEHGINALLRRHGKTQWLWLMLPAGASEHVRRAGASGNARALTSPPTKSLSSPPARHPVSKA